MIESLLVFIPFLAATIVVGIILWGSHKLLIGQFSDLGGERKFPRQLIMLGLTLIGILTIVFALPIKESSRNQLIGLIGLLISGVIAFSSTTIISNLMAGVLLRITKPFRVGDFISIGEHFGRVSERGLFDTEIQSEARDLIALPNTYCINNPVKTIRSSGTIISATLSLGYDIDHQKIEHLLIEAAEDCGLQEPFVHILELGNYSVTYRVSGFLEEIKRLISIKSSLYACVLDTLHASNIEIMSPTYMNQRQLKAEVGVIPEKSLSRTSDSNKTTAEDIAFDKAEKAEEIEKNKQQLIAEIEVLENSLKSIRDEEHKKIQQKIIEGAYKRLKAIKEIDLDDGEKTGRTS